MIAWSMFLIAVFVERDEPREQKAIVPGELESLLAIKFQVPPGRLSLVPRPRRSARRKDGLSRPRRRG